MKTFETGWRRRDDLDLAIPALVERVVRARFADDAIESVQTVVGEDSQGDPMQFITVISDDARALDGRAMLGVVRHLQVALDGREGGRFPLIRYLSREDAKQVGSVAA